ncbi:N-acetyltransferase [Roseibium aquae]|uniref:N-acetyltransferase n=1 Tax=Roseibium aquae TaxID=1323746 RepID=A0A916T7N0_9HYPH|nr:N-acetyltransferase [Roseibium aquae]GGB34735.1 N-acetyltransferase [Roseibium aquae]
MKPFCWFVRLETPEDDQGIQTLQAEAFGPGRFVRTAFRLREGVGHRTDLSFVATSGTTLAGSVRLTQIRIGHEKALLLGPLTVAPAFKNRGIGKTLLRTALEAAASCGERAVLLVGDAAYYAPLGFEPVPFGKITLPGPVDPARLLLARLNEAGPLEGAVSAVPG